MAETWLRLGEDHLKRTELLKLYELFQNRQIADLDMLYRYANYYVAVLLALFTALILALPKAYNTSFAGTLIFLPMVSNMFALQGKLMSYRFYRRYNEGRVRLSKIECILGLQGPISCNKMPETVFWPDDDAFLLGRYREENLIDKLSTKFVNRRSKIKLLKGYGAGYIIQMTYSVFVVLFSLALVGLPVYLLFAQISTSSKIINLGISLIGIAAMFAYTYCYWHTLKHMEKETLGNIKSSQ